MKKILLILSLMFLTSCSYFRENYREVNFKMENETVIHLIIFESTVPLSERSLVVYGNEYPLKGRDCEDSELKAFSNKLWSEIAEQNDLSKLNSGTMHLLQKQTESMPTYCSYNYSKGNNGEWTMR